jgi:hypothetical protein
MTSEIRMTNGEGPDAASDKGLSLGPDLPVEIFTSTAPWFGERIHALALYCSDGRWGPAFDEFCQRSLHIPRYDRWAVPGGPAWLATESDGEVFAAAAHKQLDFLVRIHELERIVLITHYACALYGQKMQRSPDECLAEQMSDVRRAAAVLRRWYPGIGVEGYLAMRRANTVSFHELGA